MVWSKLISSQSQFYMGFMLKLLTDSAKALKSFSLTYTNGRITLKSPSLKQTNVTHKNFPQDYENLESD